MRFLQTLAYVVCATAAQAEQVVFDGTIGPYQIQAQLERVEGDKLIGRYRYAGRQDWIELNGEGFAQEAIQLTETVAGETTGAFFLAVNSDELEGFWAQGKDDYIANLTPVTGRVSDLFDPIEVEEVNDGVTGKYTTGRYWVNDWFAPNYEIGFSGGAANVVRLSPHDIYVRFNFVVGPTYHIAFFQGVATRSSDDTYVFDARLEGSSEPCRLAFTFDEGGLLIDDTDNGFACQFGARAHANFDLIKVSDTAEFDGSW